MYLTFYHGQSKFAENEKMNESEGQNVLHCKQ